MAPEVFWALTPWQFVKCVEGWQDGRREDHEKAVWLMWHAEALSRARKMPPMAEFLTAADRKPKKPGIDEAAIKARFRAYQKRLDNERSR